VAQAHEGGKEGECGWLADRVGMSWQIVPTVLKEMLADPAPSKAERVMQALLQMKKLERALLKKAYEAH
jgi:predicted 3-demethylubiquinone-9 3-methyltransferase (glyoxalase superfamily)